MLLIIIVALVIIIFLTILLYPKTPDCDISSINSVGVEFKGTLPSALVVEMEISVQNPNLYGGELNKLKGDVYIRASTGSNYVQVGDFIISKTTSIEGSGTTKIPISLKLTDLPLDQLGAILLNNRVDINIRGTVELSIGPFGHAVYFQETETVNLI